jgi:flagellar biogenesis protein FliO
MTGISWLVRSNVTRASSPCLERLNLEEAMPRNRLAFALVGLLAMCLSAAAASAQSTQPAYDKAAATALENTALNFDPAAVRAAAPRAGSPSASLVSGSADLSRMALALLAVIGVIFALRWGARRMSLVPGADRSGAIKVISRSIVSPKQQVLMLQVGKRLVIVGDSAGQMHPLCEITDPDEVAALIGGSRQEANALAERNPKSFSSLFTRAAEPFEADRAPEVPALAVSEESIQNIEPVRDIDNEDVGSLLDKVRVLRQQFRQTGS